MNDELLTPRQVKEQYPLGLSTVYLLCEQRQLAHIRVGGRGRRGKILIRRSDVEEYLDRQRVTARPS
jgi:excisionase family DNA binding protein